MKNTLVLVSAALILGGSLLDGCQKNPLSGSSISFQTISQGTAATKTAYGEDFTSGSISYQAIDWQTGDEIRIVSPQAAVTDNPSRHYADYVVTAATSESGISKATVSNKDGNGLCWTDADKYDFYGVYPASAAITPEGKVSGHIEADQPLPGITTTKYLRADGTPTTSDLAYAYTVYTPDLSSALMTASATGVRESDAKPQVSLAFRPAFTAFEFNLTSADDAFTVTKAQLIAEEDNLSGEYSLTAGAGLETVVLGEAGKDVAMVMNDQIDLDKGITFTLFTLPVTNTGIVKLRITTTTGVATLRMTAKGDKTAAYQFLAGHKYRINLLKLGGVWEGTLFDITMPWDVETYTLSYEEDPIVNAGALYQSSSLSGWFRTAVSVAAGTLVEEYFSIFAPTGGKWLAVSSDPDVAEVSAEGAEATDGGVCGPVKGRVDLTVTPKKAGTATIHFYALTPDGHRYNIDSEVTRGAGQVITVN